MGDEMEEETTPAEPTAEPVAADPLQAIGAGLVADWPEPVDHFVDATKDRAAATEKEQQASMDPLQIKDKNGHYFNPELCVVGEDGLPVFTKSGLFDLKRRVKRSQLKKRPLQPDDQKEVRQQIEEQRAVADAAETAARVAMNSNMLMAGYVQLNSFINTPDVVESVLGHVLANVKDANGKEHKFSVYDIHQLSVERVLASINGGPEINPIVQLLGVFAVSSVAMFLHRKHEKRRQSFKETLVLWWLRIRGKKKVQKVAPQQEAADNGQ